MDPLKCPRLFVGSKLAPCWRNRRNLRGLSGCPPPSGEASIFLPHDAGIVGGIACIRCIGLSYGGLLYSPLFPNNGDPNLLVLRPVATRRKGGARRRSIRTSISPISKTQGPLTMADGTALQVPSENEMVPDHPKWPLPSRPTFRFVDSSSDSAQGGGGAQTAPSAQTSKRTYDDLDAPTLQRARARMRLGQLAAGNAFRTQRQLSGRGRVGAFSVADDDFPGALHFLKSGWPAYGALNKTDAPGPLRVHQIFDDARPRGLHFYHTFARGLVAMVFAGAATAAQSEFRTMHVNGGAECPLAFSHPQVWELP